VAAASSLRASTPSERSTASAMKDSTAMASTVEVSYHLSYNSCYHLSLLGLICTAIRCPEPDLQNLYLSAYLIDRTAPNVDAL